MFVAWFDVLPPDAVAIAGGKGASLIRMSQAGLAVPQGFAVSSSAFEAFVNSRGVSQVISRLTAGLNVHDAPVLDRLGSEIQRLIADNPMSADMRAAIVQAYQQLAVRCASSTHKPLPVAVRSSAVSEDGETASFAGQQGDLSECPRRG